MRAVDTNVLVRLIRHDNGEQTAAAERYIDKGAWVSTVALAEAVWVLGTIYDRSPKELARVVEMLLENGRLVIQDAPAVEDAVALFKMNPSVGFSDCLLITLARHAGHTPMGTFDKKLSRLSGAEKI